MKCAVLRINTVEIPVGNLKRANDWYQSALGFTCIWSDESHALLSGTQANGNNERDSETRILLVKTDDSTRLGFDSSSTGLRHSVVDFQTFELEGLHASLQTQGAHVDDLQAPVNTWAPRGFGFSDSEGNRLAAFTYLPAL